MSFRFCLDFKLNSEFATVALMLAEVQDFAVRDKGLFH